jgi:hypothetical protein
VSISIRPFGSHFINSSRNRLLAKQNLWIPSHDDGYNFSDDHPPSLVPVFDPAFTVTPATVIPPTITPINMAREHGIMTPVAPTFSNPLRNDADDIYQATRPPLEAPEIYGDIDIQGWKSLTAPRRIAAVRRWIILAARKYGPVEGWGDDLSQKWSATKYRDPSAAHGWLEEAKRRIKMGRSALSYLECAMEGEGSLCIEEWRDLYLQSHQLASELWGAVHGIQYGLGSVLSEKAST